jgi:hypothetical protein
VVYKQKQRDKKNCWAKQDDQRWQWLSCSFDYGTCRRLNGEVYLIGWWSVIATSLVGVGSTSAALCAVGRHGPAAKTRFVRGFLEQMMASIVNHYEHDGTGNQGTRRPHSKCGSDCTARTAQRQPGSQLPSQVILIRSGFTFNNGLTHHYGITTYSGTEDRPTTSDYGIWLLQSLGDVEKGSKRVESR